MLEDRGTFQSQLPQLTIYFYSATLAVAKVLIVMTTCGNLYVQGQAYRHSRQFWVGGGQRRSQCWLQSVPHKVARVTIDYWDFTIHWRHTKTLVLPKIEENAMVIQDTHGIRYFPKAWVFIPRDMGKLHIAVKKGSLFGLGEYVPPMAIYFKR